MAPLDCHDTCHLSSLTCHLTSPGMCNLRCVFCQNWDISQKKNGWELQGEEIADLMLKLQVVCLFVRLFVCSPV